MVRVQSVPGAAVIRITRTIFFEGIVNAILNATKAQRWTIVIAFRGVIKPVQGLHHIAELIHRTTRILTRTVSGMRSKKRNRIISPIVQLPARRMLAIELKDW